MAKEIIGPAEARGEVAYLRQQVGALEEEIQRKDDFLAMLAHELRNPLQPILTALRLMRVRDPDAHARERLVLERQMRHIVELIDDLHDLARGARGKLELDRKPIEIAEVVARALEMTSAIFAEKKHRLTVRVSRRGLVVEADAARLAQVFANLFTHAAKSTDPGGRVRIESAREKTAVAIFVSDSGAGIPPDLLPHVFDPFVQAVHARACAPGGLGLGLPLVRALVELHGGSVTAHSEGAGRGSQFVVRLPGRSDS